MAGNQDSDAPTLVVAVFAAGAGVFVGWNHGSLFLGCLTAMSAYAGLGLAYDGFAWFFDWPRLSWEPFSFLLQLPFD